jgi:hypothetical protein
MLHAPFGASYGVTNMHQRREEGRVKELSYRLPPQRKRLPDNQVMFPGSDGAVVVGSCHGWGQVELLILDRAEHS